jgi:quinoprotein glucose dehydrogenase
VIIIWVIQRLKEVGMGYKLRVVWLAMGLALFCVDGAPADDWSYYGRDAGTTRYSPLTRITPGNVTGLKPAWIFHTGDISPGGKGLIRSGFEGTPLLLDNRLYLTTPFNRVIALDPVSGKQLWEHNPQTNREQPYGDGLINRGLAAWRNPAAKDCKLTLFEATLDARLIALDGATGEPCAAFGSHGEVALTDVAAFHDGWYHVTSPPLVLDGVVVVGSAINDNTRAHMPAGTVRGYDARSGKLLWRWEPLQRPAGAGQWLSGAANAWSVMSADPKRHLVFVPTGSASPDYYGGLRPGDDRWANSVVALDVRDGKFVWGFQLVHHDLWDYDTAAAPLRADIRINGQRKEAVIVGNKTGMVYVLDAATGKPLLPVEERAVPQSDVAGEVTSPTQPFPASLSPLAPHALSPSDAWGTNDANREACRAVFAKAAGTSLFSPPSTTETIDTPGPFGGINWSGFAWDARHQRLIVSVSNLPYRVQLIPADKFASGMRGDFRGEIGTQTGAPFAMMRTAFLSPSHTPCVAPPWGELVSVDLASGHIAWRQPVGSMRDVFPGPVGETPGSLMLGGAIVTASGLVFTGGSMDRRVHALSSETGAELWSAELPASANAQPITYEADGKQFVVIAAGGSAKIDEERQSDAVMAFALP